MRLLWATLCLLLASTQVYASLPNTEPTSAKLFKQRDLYRQAMRDIDNGAPDRALAIARRLTDYPLYPYIEYSALMANLPQASTRRVLSFQLNYPNLPITQQLMESWVYVLAKQQRWHTFLRYYDPATFTGARDACFYPYALYRTGQIGKAFAEARKLWLVPHSQPEECDEIFRVWTRSDDFDGNTAWQRYVMTAQAGKNELSDYLRQFLSGKDHMVSNEFVRVRWKPSLIENTSRFIKDDSRTRQLIIFGVRRLAWRDPAAALKAFKAYNITHNFTPQQRQQVFTSIGLRLAARGDEQNLLDTLPPDLQQDPALVRAWVRLELRRLNWKRALDLMSSLPDNERTLPRWRFWEARGLSQSSDSQDRELATGIFQQLSTDRNYYGFMSADLLGVNYNFGGDSTQVSPDEEQAMELRPGVRRALELFVLNQPDAARLEWYAAISGFTPHELQVAAHVAQKWGWYRQAIKSMINAGAWNDLKLRFPLAYFDIFANNAKTWDIPLQWSLAIARQESSFMPDAHSSAGAIGIMQIMPSTARLTARQQGLNYDGWHQLKQPRANIKIGSAYLGRLLKQFNNNRIIASAAYNAGPTRVTNWLDPSLPMDVWIETLPFAETRNYVEKVLMFTAIYSYRLAKSHPMVYDHERQDFLQPPPSELETASDMPVSLGVTN